MNFLRFLISRHFIISLVLATVIAIGVGYATSQWLFVFTKHNKTVEVPDMSKMEVSVAMLKLRDLDLKFEIDSSRYDSTRSPYAVLDYYPLSGSVVKLGRRIYLKSNPSTWRDVIMPDLINKSKRIAYTKLQILGLKVGDTIYEKDAAKDVILRVMYNNREIKPGAKLPKYSWVDLVIGRGLESNVHTPSYLEMTLENAKQLIRQNFFEVGSIIYQKPSDSLLMSSDTLMAKVFYQDPPPSAISDEGLPVSLWISKLPIDSLGVYIKELDEIYNRHMEVDTTDVLVAPAVPVLSSASQTAIKAIEQAEKERKEARRSRARRSRAVEKARIEAVQQSREGLSSQLIETSIEALTPPPPTIESSIEHGDGEIID